MAESDDILIERIFHPYATEQMESFAKKQGDGQVSFVHYTSAEAALRILENKRIWMRNVTSMSDVLGNSTGLGAPTGPLTIRSATLDLNGSSPTVGALSGNAAALITDSSASSGTLTVGQSSTTTYGGSIVDGPNSPTVTLTLTGSGTLTLTGTNTYTGGTQVEGGTLVVTSPQGIEDGTNLFVGSAGSFFAPVIPAAQIPTSAAAAVSPVPEPGTLALLAAGVVAIAALRRKKQTSRLI